MSPNQDADDYLRQKTLFAINGDPFPESIREALARRVTTLSGIPTILHDIDDILDATKNVGIYERQAFEELIAAYERNTGTNIDTILHKCMKHEVD